MFRRNIGWALCPLAIASPIYLAELDQHHCPPGDSTRLFVHEIAPEAYIHWAMATGEECPGSLSDLEKYRKQKDTRDVWGNELVMLCGDNAPEDAPFFAVFSKGPDGKAGTEDDIRSW